MMEIWYSVEDHPDIELYRENWDEWTMFRFGPLEGGLNKETALAALVDYMNNEFNEGYQADSLPEKITIFNRGASRVKSFSCEVAYKAKIFSGESVEC